MRRRQLFEIHDWPQCPKVVRNGLTDFLQTANDVLNTYGPIRERLLTALRDAGSEAVVDMCSGAGGPWVKWARDGHATVPITLTDKYPNRQTIDRLQKNPVTGLHYHPESVDATAVGRSMPGFRTIFTAFHHFTPRQGKAILDDAVRNGEGIGVFEFTSRSPSHILRMLLTPLGVWLFTPLGERVSWPVLLWTYLLPVIPLVTCVDGVLSCLRSYSPDDLRELAQAPDYDWTAGEEGGVTFLIGLPARARRLQPQEAAASSD